MNSILKRVISLILVFLVFTATITVSFTASASQESDIKQEISELEKESQRLEAQLANLKKQKTDQVAIKKVIESQINNLQKEIDAYTSSILKCKNDIAASEQNIKNKNNEIADTKETFKKRIRSMYMSNSDNKVQLLLGAESFGDFLTLAQLTKTMTSQDKIIINKLIEVIAQIEKEIAANKQREEELKVSMGLLNEKRQQLSNKEAEVNSIISSISNTQNQVDNANDSIEKQIKDKEDYLNYLLGGDSYYTGPFDGKFLWPVPGFSRISAYWESNDSVHNGDHKGIDISGPWGSSSSISGANVVASAAGTVARLYNGCPHNYGKSKSCGCGGGFGNNIRIDHGKYNGNEYLTIYAHLRSVASGMYVNKHVSRGQVVGYVGSTGWSTGYHLHFGVAVNGAWKNPFNYTFVYK